MNRTYIFLALAALTAACGRPQAAGDGAERAYMIGETVPDQLVLDNGQLQVTINRWGGHYVGLRTAGSAVNPLTWGVTQEQMPDNNKEGAPFRGHFLCLGRWGSPSKAEMEAGVPHNGEPSNTHWKVEASSKTELTMTNQAPLDGLSVWRHVELPGGQPSMLVTERFVNTFSLGRMSNVVQHVTVGQPFLNPKVKVASNAQKGFNQKFCFPQPAVFAYTWPEALTDTTTKRTVDLRTLEQPVSMVSTHLFGDQDYGWITAYDPASGLLLGYVWRTQEYPWLNLWRQFDQQEQPVALGLEFGTTGIGEPYERLLSTDTRFHGQPSWEFIQPGETIEKQFMGFLVPVEPDMVSYGLSVTGQEVKVPGYGTLKNLLP